MKHTPGPWLYAQEGLDAFGIVQPDGHSIVHLVALHNSTGARHLPANARLIAAAPDLLEALTKLLDMHERCDAGFAPHVELRFAIRDMARAAIARATGEQP
jgi:hypothetical protein